MLVELEGMRREMDGLSPEKGRGPAGVEGIVEWMAGEK